MNIFINAYNLRIGGGESVGIGIIESLYRLQSDDRFYILISPQNAYLSFKSTQNISIQHVPLFYTRYFLGRLLSSFFLRYQVWKIKPDVIFSMGNYAIPVARKQLVLLHWPYIVYPDSPVWGQMTQWDWLKRKWRAMQVRKKLRFATALTVQTPLIRQRVKKYLPFPGPVHVVPSATSLKLSSNEQKEEGASIQRIKNLRLRYPGTRFLLFISAYYNHKNLEILFPLARKIKEENSSFKLLISLSPNQTWATRHFLKKIKENQLEDVILNLGAIPREELGGIYSHSDALLMPTLLETYGMTYMEAMSMGIPVFTSDLDFAHQVCGEAAFYFDPLDYRSIYDCLVQAFLHPEVIHEKVEAGKQRSSQLPSWEETTHQYLSILKSL